MKKWFKIKSRSGDKMHSVWLEFNPKGQMTEYGCDCEHGSMWRFSKKAKEEKQKCWHIKRIIRILKIEEANANPN